jgi:SMC interacting uncharacterized protein involved in chromosome segregation
MLEGQGVSSSPSYGSGGKMMESVDYSSAPAMMDRQIVKEGAITLKVPAGTLDTRVDELKTSLRSQGAEITDVRYNEYGERFQYTITIKVPPTKFETINEMLKQAGEVKGMSVSLEDVTEQYVDLDTRIRNKEVELSRLYDLYNKSDNVSDLLAVEKEVTRVETELELLKTTKERLSSRIERSTITIDIYEEKPAGEQLTNPLEGVGQLFFGALAAGIMVIVGLAGFLLPLIVIIVLLYLAYTRVFAKKRGPKEPEHKKIPPPI